MNNRRDFIHYWEEKHRNMCQIIAIDDLIHSANKKSMLVVKTQLENTRKCMMLNNIWLNGYLKKIIFNEEKTNLVHWTRGNGAPHVSSNI